MKIRPTEEKTTITVKTKSGPMKRDATFFSWWNANSKKELCEQVITTAAFLKEQQNYRYNQAGIYSRLYGNLPLFNLAGSNLSKMVTTQKLPIDRPTMNVIQSCVDTLVSRITQSRPRPMFLTDGGDYKQRKLAKQLNNFIVGEFYQTQAYRHGEMILRDAAVLGTGCIKVYEDTNTKRVALDRTLMTELYVDPNDALYGNPRQLFQLKLVDRSVLAASYPKYRSSIEKAEQAFPDASGSSSETVSDQIMVVEAWHLPSSKESGDGLHTIACATDVIFEEEYIKDKFPFAFLHYNPRMLGFWGQPLTEQLMGTQMEINKLLMTISKSINLLGVPRVFLESGSKVSKSQLNNEVGSIVTYTGTLPQYVTAPCIAPEIYEQLQRLVQYAYQQCGVSSLAASATKPAGLNSGEAIRNYDDLQSDRFASLVKRVDNSYVDLAYLISDQAKDIAKRDGKYQTVFPDKNGTQQIDLPKTELLEDPFVIQCFDTSSLPKDPSGRMEKVTDMAQAGWINPQEARRLLDFPDLEQSDKLANAAEERILSVLDAIVEDGKYSTPEPEMDLQLASQRCVQYLNLYIPQKLEESRVEMLRDFLKQVQAFVTEASAPPPATPDQNQPAAVPMAPPQSQLLPNVPSPQG